MLNNLEKQFSRFTNRLVTQKLHLPVQSGPSANMLPNAMRKMKDTTIARLKQLERAIFCPPFDYAVDSYHM